MTATTIAPSEILAPAKDLVTWSSRILSEASLTAMQRSDFEAIYGSAVKFHEDARSGLAQIAAGCSSEEIKRIRHQLRNHLNIVSGFARLIVRDLPDNLLLHMLLIRQILTTSDDLIDRVNALRQE